MPARHSFRWFWLALTAAALAFLIIAQTAKTQSAATATVAVAGGMRVITFDAAPGRIKVFLPDDMAAGDTISGTVSAEPKGNSKEEQAKNRQTLKGYLVDVDGKIIEPFGTICEEKEAPITCQTFFIYHAQETRLNARVILKTTDGNELVRASFPFDPLPIPTNTGVPSSTPRVPTVIATDFLLPAIGQQGRPVETFGPFDGNAANTSLRFGPVGSTIQDFEKNTENVSGGFGLIRPLAESPRKVVFEAPKDFTGPVKLMLKEGTATTQGQYRNLGVHLTAPKTNLMKGEKTTVRVEVNGLEGIKQPVPLQLDATGVINMDGGNFQNLRIKPSEVTPEGRYTINRAITGVQAGGFNVTATVIVRRFDFRLQDDADPNRLFHFNSFTGDYLFACGGGSCRPGSSTGGTQTGGASTGQPSGSPPLPPVTFPGTGKMQMKGCIITMSHNAPDRRVFARLDACTKTGDASVETTSPKANFSITDKNVTDNTAASPPPK